MINYYENEGGEYSTTHVTYNRICEYTKERYGFIPKGCWIADIKEQCGLPVRKSWNRRSPNKREVPCPTDKVEKLKTVFHELGMI